jgi:hypothetical protein
MESGDTKGGADVEVGLIQSDEALKKDLKRLLEQFSADMKKTEQAHETAKGTAKTLSGAISAPGLWSADLIAAARALGQGRTPILKPKGTSCWRST